MRDTLYRVKVAFVTKRADKSLVRLEKDNVFFGSELYTADVRKAVELEYIQAIGHKH